MAKLLATIGSSRSGKSTYCDEWAKKPNRVIVAGDDIRLALHGCRYSNYAEPYVEAIKTTMIRTLLFRGFDVIVDATHTTEYSIKKILQLNDDVEFIYIPSDLETCIERAKNTGKPDLVPVIKRHHQQIKYVIDNYGSYDNLIRNIEFSPLENSIKL